MLGWLDGVKRGDEASVHCTYTIELENLERPHGDARTEGAADAGELLVALLGQLARGRQDDHGGGAVVVVVVVLGWSVVCVGVRVWRSDERSRPR